MNIKLSEKDKIKISNSEDVFGIMQRILLRDNKVDQEKEHFWVIGMNAAGYLVNIELVSLGSARSTEAEPMNIFRIALIKGSIKIILVHNHPSGRLKPSRSDEDLTDRLIQVGRIIDVDVDDHLIISTKGFFSFANEGLMDKLADSLKFVPTFEIIDRVRAEERKIRKEIELEHKEERRKHREAIKNKNEEVRIKSEEARLRREEAKEANKKLNSAVRLLLAQQIPLEQISEALGIPSEEVQKISKSKPAK